MATKNKATKAKPATKATKAPKGKPAKVATKRATTGEGGKFDRAPLKTTWTAKVVAEKRAQHHKVQVGSKGFGSVYKAFLELGLPVWQHQAFRKALKIKRKLPFLFKGKTLNFALAKD